MPNSYFDVRNANQWKAYLTDRGLSAGVASSLMTRDLYSLHENWYDVSAPPIFFTQDFEEEMARTAIRLINIVSEIPQKIFGGNFEAWMDFLRLSAEDRNLLDGMITPKFLRRAVLFARPDALMTDNGMRVVEINVAPPIGGLGVCDEIASHFNESDYFSYLREHGLKPHWIEMGAVWAQALRSTCDVSLRVPNPVFFEGMADAAEDYLNDCGRIPFHRQIRSAGFDVITGPIEELCVRSDGVFFHGIRVHLVFTCSTYMEMRDAGVPNSLIRSIARADDEGIVDFISPPTSILFDNKANLVLLSDESVLDNYSREDRVLLHESIVPTQWLNVGTACQNREQWVIKPTDESQGCNVIIGESMKNDEWVKAACHADNSRPNIMQKLVEQTGLCAGIISDEIKFQYCLGPTVFNNQYGGVFLRQTPYHEHAAVVNAARGAEIGTGFTFKNEKP